MKAKPQKPLPGWLAWLTSHERGVVLAFALLLFLLNLVTFSLYPTNWMDEALFPDPAINYVTGKGFTSSAWFESSSVTWSGNVPLYTWALVPWVKVFGIGLLNVRAFNYLVISLVIPLFWSGIKRLGCLPSPSARLALVITMFLSFPLCFLYRSARPDCLGILICAGAVWAWPARSRYVRNACLFLAGFCAPFSGLQLIGYFGLICVLAWFWEGKRVITPLTAVALGMLAGALTLFLYYYLMELTGVLATIREARQLNHAPALHMEGQTFLGQVTAKARRVVADHLGEYAVAPTLAALLILVFGREVWGNPRTRTLWLVAVGSSLALVTALLMTLHYLAYYHWMNYVILAVTLFVILGRVWNSLGFIRKGAIVCLIAFSAMSGLPLRLVVNTALGHDREMSQMQQLVAKNLRPTDIVFTDYMGYYPAKIAAAKVYVPAYARTAMTAEERQSVNVVILDPINYEGYLAAFTNAGTSSNAGAWKKVDGFAAAPGPIGRWVLRIMPNYVKQPTSCGYSITILRREAVAESP